MSAPVLHVIIGSTRPGRIGPAIARWFAEQACADGRFEVEILDLAEFDLPMFDEPHHPRLRQYTKAHTRAWSAAVDRSDAIVFVHPEYNHSVNGALKNAIDFLSLEWADKPVSFVSYGGVSGGIRAVQALKPIVAALRMFPISAAVPIMFPGKHFDADGTFVADDAHSAAAASVLGELFELAAVVKPMRAAKADAAA